MEFSCFISEFKYDLKKTKKTNNTKNVFAEQKKITSGKNLKLATWNVIYKC